jgi:hypothetical protein
LLVDSGGHESLLSNAHRALIPAGDEEPGSVFGASWRQIQQIVD